MCMALDRVRKDMHVMCVFGPAGSFHYFLYPYRRTVRVLRQSILVLHPYLTAQACWPRVCFYFRSASISPWPMVHVSHSSLHSCCNNVSLILRRHLDGCSCYSTRSPESALHQMTASTPPPRGFGYTAVIKCCNMHHHKRGKREVGAG